MLGRGRRTRLKGVVVMRGDDMVPQLVRGDQQGCRVRATRHGDQDSIADSEQWRSAKVEEKWFVGVGEQHGGAGWTRTSDNAIMSRALYHLSYGTAQAGRELGALKGEDPILRSVPAPSACASSLVAWPAPLAFSCSSLLQIAARSRHGRLGGWGQIGCGAWIRTKDLRVMSPTSCRCSTPRRYYTSLSRKANPAGRPI